MAAGLTDVLPKIGIFLDSVEGPNGKVEYAYNAAGQKTATQSPSGTTRYGYDTLGRLKTISDQPTGAASATPIASYSYDAVGNLAGVMRGNGVASQYDYDDLNRLQNLTHAKGAATLASYGYTVRGDGKRTAISEQVLNADAGRVTTRSLAYEFDASGRLTLERGRDGLGVAYENAFTYDSVGNRTLTIARKAANAAATTWAHETAVTGVFNANDQLTNESSVVDGGAPQLREYDYDGNGSEKTVTSGGQTSTNGWSFEGKLTATAKLGGGGIANSFDAAGDRLSRTENVGLPSQKTTKYLVDTDVAYAQVIEERAPDSTDADGASVLQARYVWGPSLAPLAMWRKGADGVVRLSYYLADGQESVRQLADSSGDVTDSYHFDAFGRPLAGGSGDTENPFRYTGQQLDSDGRYYLRARFYNPGNGRFLSHDPLLGVEGDPISMHRYIYASADGVTFNDPTGEESSLVGMGVSMSIGNSIRSISSNVYHGIYERAKDTLLYGPGTALQNAQKEALIIGALGASPFIADVVSGMVANLASRIKLARRNKYLGNKGYVDSKISNYTKDVDKWPSAGIGRLNGQIASEEQIIRIQQELNKINVKLITQADDFLAKKDAMALFRAFENKKTAYIYVKKDATIYEIAHEIAHAHQWHELGYKRFRDIGQLAREKYVYDELMVHADRLRLTAEEQVDAIRVLADYTHKNGGKDIHFF